MDQKKIGSLLKELKKLAGTVGGTFPCIGKKCFTMGKWHQHAGTESIG